MTGDEGTRLREFGPFVFGGNVIGWTLTGAELGETLDCFVERGGVAIDTADNYTDWVEGSSYGTSERLLGQWLRASGARESLHIGSKVGMARSRPGLSRANVLRSAEQSLDRLNTDYLDVYYAHVDDPETDLEETLGAFDELHRAGLIRAFGYSNISADRLREAIGIAVRDGLTPITFFQGKYNVVDHATFDRSFAPIVAGNGLSAFGYHSLESGLLSGKYLTSGVSTDHTPKLREVLADPRAMALVERLDAVARRLGVPTAGVALAWFRYRAFPITPLASARSVTQLAELFSCRDCVLSADDVEYLSGDAVPDDDRAENYWG